MTYISSLYSRAEDRVLVWERDPQGRRLVRYASTWYFYVPNENGTVTAITGEKVERLTFDTEREMQAARNQYPIRFESDISVLDRCMMNNYRGKEPPRLNVGLFDIEVDFNPEIGFAGVSNPYASVNAISVYLSAHQQMVTLAVPPRGWVGPLPDDLKDVFICKDEYELLLMFAEIIEDVDFISGWNSRYFDVPYLGRRYEMLFGKRGLRKLCFKEAPDPHWDVDERFGEEVPVLEIKGRVHLDYLQMFRKFNLEGRPSYSLAAVAEAELDIEKLTYEGSLYDLYNGDFPQFCRYNIRDTDILVQLDAKFRYIELANRMVHEATVNFPDVLKSVHLIDTATINFIHGELNQVVYDKRESAGERVEGALVLSPPVGQHNWICSCDINSLYPSTMRSLNLSPEMIFGQLSNCESDWRELYKFRKGETDGSHRVNLILEPPRSIVDLSDTEYESYNLSVKELEEFLQDSQLACSAYGTILKQNGSQGVIPAILTGWFKGRKQMQAEKKKWAAEADKLKKEKLIKLPETLLKKLTV